jgi:2-amino-4-hydroxy-6-hydroxymethyldihydropteridine diphosphokinase
MDRNGEVLLLLGGNEGDLKATFQAAEAELARSGEILASSRDHWTEPWGFQDERSFLNRALLLKTSLEPDSLMAECLRIEKMHGRIREPGMPLGPRTLDLDILLIGMLEQRSPILEVPHPRMHQRLFALQPSADLVPNWVHPLLGRTVLQLLNELLPTYA